MIVTSITDAIPHGIGHCSIVFRPVDDENNEIEFDSIYLDWSSETNSKIFELELIASAMVQLEKTVFVLGRLGQIVCILDDVLTQERIDGPDNYGFLTDIKIIGDAVVVAGMCRQVYLRNDRSHWDRLDAGVLDDAMPVDRVTGFRAIDGISVGDMYAVGLEGEIWNHRDGTWRQIDSPTNLTLEQVKAISSNDVYAVGQAGVILHGRGGRFEVVEQTLTEDDFWGLEFFNGVIYLTTDTNIFKLNAKEELEMVPATDKMPQNFSRLRVSHGILWSIGPDKVYWTKDGSMWQEAKIFETDALN